MEGNCLPLVPQLEPVTTEPLKMFTVFVRNWWKHAPGVVNVLDPSLNGLEPDPSARKTKLFVCETEEEARAYAMDYNKTHKPGRLSRKAEYTSNY